MILSGDKGVSPIIHISRNLQYRNPFGAAESGSYVYLSVDVSADLAPPILCYSYGLSVLSYHEKTMKKEKENRYSIKIRMPSEPCLFFYWFRLIPIASNTDAGDEAFFYVRSSKDFTGAGRISPIPARVGADEHRTPHAFQITVYSKNLSTPDWMKGALIYQIFPDRFSRDSSFSYEETIRKNNRPERIIHQNWDEDVDIDGKPETGYIACDFFGGSLSGIAEKADYLERLNVELIYLNPIFSAKSNHRYDTGNYMETDSLLGGEEGFSRFDEEMRARKIRYILDGVFSHTGADSIYFNKYGRYPEKGAYQALTEGGESRYFSWYSFSKSKSGQIHYDSWWGFPELPNVNENDLTYRDYILGEDGVIAHWLRKGASGFRLDVSDELPDSFIREIHTCVREHTGDEGVVMGEVWEDASNKVSYGAYRDFVLGRTHDSVMGYPFREAVLGYVSGKISAEETDHLLETCRENYPASIYYCVMNLLSSHDVPRAITALSGARDPGDRRKQRDIRLDDNQREIGMKLMRLGFVFQIGYIGCPSVYYGDEIGMEGYRDPFNRRTYPWDKMSEEKHSMLEFFREMSTLRKRYPVLRTGYYRTIQANGDVFIFDRTLDENGKDFFGIRQLGPRRIIFALNRNRNQSHTVDIPISDTDAAGDEKCDAECKEPIVKYLESSEKLFSDEKIFVPAMDFRVFVFDAGFIG